MKSFSGLLLAGLLAATPAAAQDRPTVTLAAEDPARWDVAGLAGWLGGNKTEVASDWDGWYEAASFSASVGYHWSPHVKLDVDLSTTTEGGVGVDQTIAEPGEPFPTFIYGEHRFRSTSAGVGLVYQFFENAWFHPFAGVGVEAERERARVDLLRQPYCARGPCTPVLLPSDASVSYTARPFVSGGFKWYVAERAFIRSDVRMTLSRDGAESVRWRAGIGVDF